MDTYNYRFCLFDPDSPRALFGIRILKFNKKNEKESKLWVLYGNGTYLSNMSPALNVCFTLNFTIKSAEGGGSGSVTPVVTSSWLGFPKFHNTSNDKNSEAGAIYEEFILKILYLKCVHK